MDAELKCGHWFILSFNEAIFLKVKRTGSDSRDVTEYNGFSKKPYLPKF